MTATGNGSPDGGVPAVGVAEHARVILEKARGLSRNLAYHRRARLEAALGEASGEVDRQIQELHAYSEARSAKFPSRQPGVAQGSGIWSASRQRDRGAGGYR